MAGDGRAALMEKAYYFLAEKRYSTYTQRTTSETFDRETVWHLSTTVISPLQQFCNKVGTTLEHDLCFHASSLPCLHTFWHAIPTSSYICNVFYFLVSILHCVNLKIDVNLSYS